ALHEIAADDALAADGEHIARALEHRFGQRFSESAFARHVMQWLSAETEHGDDLDLALRYAAWALRSPAGQARHRHGVLFKVPQKLNPERLVEADATAIDGAHRFHAEHLRRREGFALTDAGADLVAALDQANY